MKIVSLTAENVKKLVAVEITPDGNIVEITGANGQGKTSVLDSIWWALSGAGNLQPKPIRKGETKARIRLDLGELVVTREMKCDAEGNDLTTSLRVENAEGAKYDKPQAMLDAMLGAMTFDPLEFMRMDDKEQFVALRKFAPLIDFESHETAQAKDYSERTDKNRRAKEVKARANGVMIEPNTPDEPVDEDAIGQEMANVGKQAADRARMESARAAMSDELRRVGQRMADIDSQIMALQHQRVGLKERDTEIGDEMKKWTDVPEVPDVATIQAKLAAARRTNEAVRNKKAKQELVAESERLESESLAITNQMQNRERDLNAAMSAVTFPVEGLQLSPQRIVYFNGVPFKQASDAEQLRVSMAFAMAGAKKIRVARIRDGSLLDDNSMGLIAKMADDNDVQVWIERVNTGGNVGIVIDAGKVASTPKSRAKAAV